jgi:uncharacterized delta-60 repeat protein
MTRVALEALEGRELLASVAPDRSFGDDGTSHIDYVGSFIDEARLMAVQRDGKIVMAGTSEGSQIEMLLARFHPNGKRDKSFGNGGIMRKSVGFTDPQDVVVQRDGKILLAGTVLNELAVVRLNANGSADKSFGGGDGVAQVTILTNPVWRFGEANGIHVLKDGSILVAGSARTRVGGDHEMVVARLRPDGSVDASFGGGDGWAHVGSTEHESARDLAVDKAGRIVVAGSSGTKGALFRFTRKGALDEGFGEGGVLAIPQRSFRSEELYSVWATDAGGIVASGRGAGGVMVVGLDAGGEPVSSFGREGRRDYVLHRGWDVGVEVIPRTGGAFTVLGQTGTTRRDGGTNPQRAGVYLMHLGADGRWDREAGGKVRLRSFSGGRGLDRADAA